MPSTRYLKYILIGLVFGVADWYYLDALSCFPWQGLLGNGPLAPVIGIPLIILLNWGIWLVPVLPAAVLEVRRTRSIRRAAGAAVTIWCAAILAYYAWYALLLTFVGLPGMDFLQIGNRASPTYWPVWLRYFNRLILGQFAEWIVVAVTGGAVVGAGSAWLYRRRSTVRA